MRRYTVEISNLAQNDILRNTDYIAFNKKSPGTALSLSRGIHKQIQSLSINPYRHNLDEDDTLSALQIRKHYFKNYKIYYTIDDAKRTVYIVRLLHMLVDGKSALIRSFNP